VSGRRLARGLALAGALALGAPSARAAMPAAGGAPLLAASEQATLVAVGTVRGPERVDLHGRAAWLEVETVLSGTSAPGARVRFAWEELAQARPDRFVEGDRILVALGPLPSGSLWRQRFPVTPGAAPVRALAAGGDAFLRAPTAATLDPLGRYLALAPDTRRGPEGAHALAELVSGADPVVAIAALDRLATIPNVAAALGEPGVGSLRTALEDASRPLAVRSSVATFAGEQHVEALRPALAALAASGGELAPDALAALVALDGGLAADRAEALLASADPRIRAVAARGLAGPKADPRLAALLRTDPSPDVRAAAVTTLLSRGGPAAVDDAAPGLFDPDPVVKTATAQGLGRLGERAVPTLQQLTMSRGPEESRGPLAALSLAGPAGTSALQEIAETHPDPKVRTLARFALGEAPSHDRGGADLDPGSGPAAPPAEPPGSPPASSVP